MVSHSTGVNGWSSMSRRDAAACARRRLRRAADGAHALARRTGILGYQPERRSAEAWTESYDAGHLAYYGDLRELGRYSAILGYVSWFGRTAPGGTPSILDVGCGPGLLRERLDPAAFSEFVGVDVSEAAITEAVSRQHPRSRFLVGDVMSLELGRFDVIVLNEVVYYVADVPVFLARLRALLTPGGVVVVSMWRHPADRVLWRTIDGVLPIVDRVEVRNRANAVNPRGWMVAACRPS